MIVFYPFDFESVRIKIYIGTIIDDNCVIFSTIHP